MVCIYIYMCVYVYMYVYIHIYNYIYTLYIRGPSSINCQWEELNLLKTMGKSTRHRGIHWEQILWKISVRALTDVHWVIFPVESLAEAYQHPFQKKQKGKKTQSAGRMLDSIWMYLVSSFLGCQNSRLHHLITSCRIGPWEHVASHSDEKVRRRRHLQKSHGSGHARPTRCYEVGLLFDLTINWYIDVE